MLLIARAIVIVLIVIATAGFFRHGGSAPPGGLLSVALNVQNVSGSTESATYATIGHPFKPGDVQPADNLVWTIGGTDYYVQKDVKSTNSDGSVQYAVLSAKIPSVAATTTSAGTLHQGSASAPSPGAPSAATLAASSWNVAINFAHFYIPTPTTTFTSGSGGIRTVQVTCVNGAGESTPSLAVQATATYVVNVPDCRGAGTGWNVYDGGHLQNVSPIPIATTTYTVSSPTSSGAAPPSTNTADLGTSDSTDCKSALSTAITLSGATPGTPSLSTTAGGSQGSRTYYVKNVYAGALGWTAASAEQSIVVGANQLLVVTSPSSSTGAVGWDTFVSTSSGAEVEQNLVMVAIGTNWTEPTTGLLTTGQLATPSTQDVLRTWLSGPAVNEYEYATLVDSGLLRVRCYVRAYADTGVTSTDVIFDNSWAFLSAPGPLAYQVSITQGATTMLAATQVNQYLYAMWDWNVWSAGILDDNLGAPNIQFNIPYWIATGVTPPYDQSYTPDLSNASAYSVNSENATYTTPLPPMQIALEITDFGKSGGITQGIAPNNGWSTQWLMSQNYKARQNMVAVSKTSGTVPWHFFDESTNLPPSAVTYAVDDFGPPLAFGSWAVQTSIPQNTMGNPWATSDGYAHAPDFNFLSYLATGNRYYLDLLQFQSEWAILEKYKYGSVTNFNSVPCGYFNSRCDNAGGQTRAQAWTMRTVSQGIYATPDSDAFKIYLAKQQETTLAALVSDYTQTGGCTGVNTDSMNQWGQLRGFIYAFPITASISPFENEYVHVALAHAYRLAPRNSLVTNNIQCNALAMMKFVDMFTSGIVTQGSADGSVGNYPSLAGFGYHQTVCTSNCISDQYTTWAAFETNNINASCPSNPNQCGVPTLPPSPPMNLYACCLADQGPGVLGGYPEFARAGEADVISLTASPLAIWAWAININGIYEAYSLRSASVSGEYSIVPGWSTAPIMPDGQPIQADHIQVSLSASSPTLTVGSGDSLISCRTPTGTCTLIGTTNAYDVMTCDSTSAACDIKGGSGFTYMHGGWATNTFEIGAVSASGQADVENFNPATSTLKVKSNLNGSGITTDAALLTACSNVGGNATFAVGTGKTITMHGLEGALLPCSSMTSGNTAIN